MKKEITPLSDKELLERKEYCNAYKLCFISKEPLAREFFAEYHSEVIGIVKINQHKFLPR